MTLLLPRFPAPACETLVRDFLDRGPEGWAGFDSTNLPGSVRFAATGGSRVGSEHLSKFRLKLVELARAHGFRGTSDRNSLAAFDAEAAAWLAQSQLLSTGEALRDDVWSFISTVVAPDIVYWRFGAAIERYSGGVRNTFQRLWMRGRALDRGPEHPERWKLLTELTEDALVQITERPSIGGDPALSLAVAEAWSRAAKIHGRARMENIMRRAILTIRIRNEIRSLSDLPDAVLTGFLDEMFGIASREQSEDFRPAADQYVSQEPSSLSLAEAIPRILAESERRNWLSPKSRAALNELSSGNADIGRSERNALDYLLSRLTETALLSVEVDLVRSAISDASGSSSAPERPRKRSWAIWRAR